jgi:hypothetical protein
MRTGHVGDGYGEVAGQAQRPWFEGSGEVLV